MPSQSGRDRTEDRRNCTDVVIVGVRLPGRLPTEGAAEFADDLVSRGACRVEVGELPPVVRALNTLHGR